MCDEITLHCDFSFAAFSRGTVASQTAPISSRVACCGTAVARISPFWIQPSGCIDLKHPRRCELKASQSYQARHYNLRTALGSEFARFRKVDCRNAIALQGRGPQLARPR